MKQYQVICEKFGEEFDKIITVNADDEYDAMATAQEAYGAEWMPVDVLDVSDC